MHPGAALFGLDPLGWEVVALCALAGLALASVIVVGFALLWRAERGTPHLASSMRRAPRELGLLALWRLERSLRGADPARRRRGATPGPGASGLSGSSI